MLYAKFLLDLQKEDWLLLLKWVIIVIAFFAFKNLLTVTRENVSFLPFFWAPIAA